MTPQRIADYLTWYDLDDNGCWNWFARKTPAGYGRAGRVLAHRFFYEQHVGPIPAGLTIDHLCRNRACVNPAHLEPVTLSENVKRSWPREPGTYGKSPSAECQRGHQFSAQNTYVSPKGDRVCKECRKLQKNAWLAGKTVAEWIEERA